MNIKYCPDADAMVDALKTVMDLLKPILSQKRRFK